MWGISVASGFLPGLELLTQGAGWTLALAGGGSQPRCREAGNFTVSNLLSYPKELAALVSALVARSFVW